MSTEQTKQNYGLFVDGNQLGHKGSDKSTIPAEKLTEDAVYWRKRTDEYSLQLAHTHNHAEKLAASLREIIDMPRNERNAIDLLARVEKVLAAYESEARQ